MLATRDKMPKDYYRDKFKFPSRPSLAGFYDHVITMILRIALRWLNENNRLYANKQMTIPDDWPRQL